MVTSDLITPLEAADPSHRGLQMDLKDSQAVFRVRSGLISAFQNHPRHPLMCTHLEMVHSAHCALCTWQGDALHTVCSHLHLRLHLALCTMHYALGYYALCTVLAPCTCTVHMHYAPCTMHYALHLHLAHALGTMHYALYLHLALPAPSQPRIYVEWAEQREGGDERGEGGRNVMKSFLYTIQERTKCWFPSLYFTNMSFLEMQIPHREVCTLKIKPRTNDQIHGGPNQNILTIVVVVLVVIVVIVVTAVMFLESYPHDWCFPLPSPLRTTPSSPCQPAWHLPATRAPSGLTSRTLQRHKEQNRGRPHSGGQGRM